MKFTHTLGASLCAAILITGCGKSDDTTVAPPPAPKPPEQAAVVATQPVVAPPAPTTPPPVGNMAEPAPAVESESAVIKDPDGKTLSAINYLQSLVDAYNRTRAGQSDGTPWPPLTDLQQLVNMRMVARLPVAPAGQKFVFDAASAKVTLAPK